MKVDRTKEWNSSMIPLSVALFVILLMVGQRIQ
jgi:hypothetical protein